MSSIFYGDITGSNGEPFVTIVTASQAGTLIYTHQGSANTTDKIWGSITTIANTTANIVLMISGSGFGVLPVLSGAVSGGLGWTPITHNGFKLLSGQSLYARVENTSEEGKALFWGDVNRVTSSI